MTLTITNPASNPAALHGVGVTDTLPAGLKVATPNNLAGSCPSGTVTAAAGSSTVSASGATLAPGATCTIIVDVKGTVVGTQANTTGAPTSTEGGSGTTASASVVVALAPSLVLSFTPSSIAVGNTSTLHYTVANTNGAAFLVFAFTDTLPAGMTIAPSGLTGTCGGGTITADDGTNEVDLSGATIAANATCTFTIKVTSSTIGTAVNTTSPISSSNAGTGAAASASLLVLQGPTMTTAFSAPSVGAGNPVAVLFTIHNPNPGTTLTGIAVGDTLPTRSWSSRRPTARPGPVVAAP